MILDFKEIPQANVSSGYQDTFELFSRDFLEILGYEVLQHPDRGADGKKDLIVQEIRSGVSGVTRIKWLVSCKHYAHSGRSVSDTDELNIFDRVSVHQCNGFIGFYSTLPATSLSTNLNALKNKMEIQSFDREQIEKILLETPQGLHLASRYFPTSYNGFKIENPKPVKIFHEELVLNCEYCNKNLLEDKSGILVLLRPPSNMTSKNYKRKPYSDAYISCKGRCDNILKNKYLQNESYIDEWVDISDFLTPTGYIKKIMAWFNSLNFQGEKVEEKAFAKVKKVFLIAFPHISREQTTVEKKKIEFYLQNGIEHYL